MRFFAAKRASAASSWPIELAIKLVQAGSAALIALSMGYFVNRDGHADEDLAEARALMSKTPTPLPTFTRSTLTPFPSGCGDVWEPLYPKPTEAPMAPSPSPTPQPIGALIQAWSLDSLDEAEVGIRNLATGERFTLRLHSTWEVKGADGPAIAISLCRVDLDSMTATFCCNGHEETKAF